MSLLNFIMEYSLKRRIINEECQYIQLKTMTNAFYTNSRNNETNICINNIKMTIYHHVLYLKNEIPTPEYKLNSIVIIEKHEKILMTPLRRHNEK